MEKCFHLMENRIYLISGKSVEGINIFKQREERQKLKKATEIENKAVESSIPVLFLSGEYDNETPVKWAKSMTKNFENSYHLVFKGWKHTPTTNWSNQCAMQAANDFFNHPSVLPNPDCFVKIKSPEFMTE